MGSADLYIDEVHDKRRKRRIYYFSIAGFLALDLLLAGTAWIFTRTSLFRAQDVSVSGNSAVSAADILDLVHANVPGRGWMNNFLGFNNLLVWPKSIATSNLALLPAIETIGITKDYNSKKVDVVVTEREPYATWCRMELSDASDTSAAADCFWFDTSGVIFKRALASEGSLILAVRDYSGEKVLGLGLKVLLDEQIPNLISVLNVIKKSGVNIEEIRLNDAVLGELEVDTFNGPKLYFSLRFKADDTLPVMQDFISKAGFKNLEYVDFRVEKRVYYK